MDKRLTYQTGKHFEWLLALSLAISLCTYTGYTDSVEIWQSQPEQVELLLSGQNNADSGTLSYHQVFSPELLRKPVKRSREYEAHVQAVYQSRIKVAMGDILEQSVSYSLPVFSHQATTVIFSSEESSSDISG